jgi:hypothetical protein
MIKRSIIALITIATAGVLLSAHPNTQPSSLNSSHFKSRNTTTQAAPIKTPLCDGTNVTSDCTVDGIKYKTYIYHPAVAEVAHQEQTVTYNQKITGYCTQCNDGTYSPSCATGRGACSWHNGVSVWNAPIYSNVPVYSMKTVIDAPAQEAYYEKVQLP